MRKIFILLLIFMTIVILRVSAEVKDYRISVNDLIEISVYDEPDLTKTVRVASDGTISYPLLGNVSVKGLTAKELESQITNLLERDYLVNPQVSVLIKEYAKISVLGQVRFPGSYELKGGLSIIDAIAAAGGFTDNANKRKVKLIRYVDKEKETIEINMDDLMSGPDASKWGNLKPDDVIYVDELGTVSIIGQVRNPGRYALKNDMTALEAIALAGGLTELAAADGTKVIRVDKDGKRVTMRVPVGAILRSGDKRRDIKLLPDDTIVIPESFF